MKSDNEDEQGGMEDESKTKRDTEDRDTYGVRDVLGKFDYTHSARKDNTPDTKHNYRVSPLALSHFDAMHKHYSNKETKLINEVENLENELTKNS